MESNQFKLTRQQLKVCEDTISSNTFYRIVMNALCANAGLSVVRMGDGERLLYDECSTGRKDEMVGPTVICDETWFRDLGCWQIPKGILLRRLKMAAESCTYFAPSVNGIWRESYNVHKLSTRKRY